ncbi:MAG: hypothetical protein EBW90_09370 [Rhodobacteraceae bacterium]|jgi:hypothetical protein|nr:hypothetical protein [Rhodobacterales bacterium]NCX58601.1 hypothetical protein [Paracoccaceae bacterium]NCX86951.1 hypothetical protein [Paracoccaceae bacterium]
MKNKLIIFTLSILMYAIGSSTSADSLWDRIFFKKKEFVATIKIKNNCQLETRYFIVRNLDTGHYASFNNGIAKLKVFRNAPLQLQLSPSVKYISFEGVAVAASENVTITADCSERTLEMIKNDK